MTARLDRDHQLPLDWTIPQVRPTLAYRAGLLTPNGGNRDERDANS